MVAIVAGSSFGLGQTSSKTLGSQGLWGNASSGYLGSNYLVNASTGNLIIQQQDEILTGVGPDLALSRTYNSLGLSTDDNGDNWRESSQRVVNGLTGTVNTAGSTVKRTDWDGSEQVFTYDTTKAAYIFKDPAGAYDKLTFASGTNQWTWIDGGSRTVELYDNANGGRIISSTDLDGKALSFTYTGTNLTRITDANGEYTVLSWTGSNLTQIVAYKSDGTLLDSRVRYAYDTSNRLTSVTIDLSPTDNSVSDGNTVTYSYTYEGTSTRVASIGETGSGSLVAFTYDATSHKITNVTETAASGDVRSTSFDYSVANRTRVTDALGNITDYSTDSAGRITSITYPPAVSGASAQTVQYTWDATTGRIASVTDPMGKVTSYLYDANGNNIRVTDAAGDVVDRTFDATTNALLTETHYLVPDPDGAGSATATSPVTTRYAYDSKNHLRFTVSAEGRVTEYRYNTLGQLVSTFAYSAAQYDISALASNAVLSEVTLATWVAGLGALATAERTDTAYDFRGNVASQTQYSDLDVNRLYNSQFENNAAGWGINWDPNHITTGITTGMIGALPFIRASFNATGSSQGFTLGNLYKASVTPGEQFMLQAGVEGTGAIGTISLKVIYVDATGAIIVTSYTKVLSGAQAFNTRLSVLTSAAPAGAVMAYVELVAYSSGAGAGTVSITQPMLSQAAVGQTTVPAFNAGPSAANSSLSLPASSSFNRISYTYDQAGLLLSRQESGKTGSEVYTYDGLGRQLTSTDFAGNVTQVAFTDASRRTVVTLANGETKTTNYNGLGQALDTTLAGTGVTSEVESYKYDKLGELRSTVDAAGKRDYDFYDAVGRRVGHMDALGYLTEYKYDAANRLVATVEYATTVSSTGQASLFDASGNPLIVAIASVRPTTTSSDIGSWTVYDSANRVIETVAPNGAVVQLTYDGTGQLIKKTAYANLLAAATVTGFQTTAPTTLTLPTANATTDRTTRYFYDNQGLNIGTLDADGALTQTKYDAAGQAVETVQYATLATASLRTAGDWTSLLNSVTATANPNDRHQYLVYDGQGRIRFTLDANLRPTEMVYDAAGNLLRTIDYGASIAATTSYTMGYVQAQISSLSLATNAATRTNRVVYENLGRKAFTIDAQGDVVGYTYDQLGNVTKATRYAALFTNTGDPTLTAMQSWATTNTNAADRITRVLYDTLGRAVYDIDAEGFVTAHQYDAKDRVTKDIRYASRYTVTDTTTASALATTIGTPAGAITTSYGYDADDNRTSITDGQGYVTNYVFDAFGHSTKITDPAGAITVLAYDGLNRVTARTSAYGTSVASTTYFGYDGAGNLTWQTDGRGNTISYTYDALGNQLSANVPLSGTSTIVYATTTHVYDVFGNVVKTTDPRGYSTYSYYDKLNRLQYQVDAEGYATQTTYSIGNAVQSVRRMVIKPGGTGSVTTLPAFTTSASDAVTSFTLDKLDRVTGLVDAEGKTESYVLNAFGDRTSVTNKLGGTTVEVYDKRGLLVQETLPVGSTKSDGTIASANIVNKYEYDALGNRTKMIEATGLAEQRTTIYTYDADNRLTTKTSDAVTILDPTSMATTSVTPVERYYYDADSNLIETRDDYVDGSGTHTLSRTLNYFDAANRKIASLSPVGTLSTLSYDANDNVLSTRVYKDALALPASPGGVAPPPTGSGAYRETVYTYDRNNRLVTTSITGVTVGSYTKANGQFATSTLIQTTNVYDAAGNVIQTTDANGGNSYTFYNKLGQKVAQVDQSLYLTTWTLDKDGNVLTETRFATKLSAAPTAGGTVPTATADATNDRTTNFTYDKMGRRLTEDRLNVQATTVSGGSIATSGVTARITYTYNGLGEVTSKKEATGDTTSYGYDVMGRQTSVTGPAITDYTGTAVSDQQVTSYDGLNNATRTVENGARVSTFSYGAGGRLATSTDAVGNATGYYYDATGHVTATTSYQLKSDGTGIWNAQAIKYDAAGRQVSQTMFQLVGGTTWTKAGDSTDYFYDSFGEVIARGTNSNGDITKAQEFSDYDNAGRVWRTNMNDGVTRAYIYDANGNATLLMQTLGSTDLHASTIATATDILQLGGVSKTFSVYDGRNQLTDSFQPSSNNSGAPPIHATQVGSTGQAIFYFNSSASINSASLSATGAQPYVMSSSDGVAVSQAGYIKIQASGGYSVDSIQVDRTSLLSNGGGNIHVLLECDHFVPGQGTINYSTDLGNFSASDTRFNIDGITNKVGTASNAGDSYTRIIVYQEGPNGIGRINLAIAQIGASHGSTTSTNGLNVTVNTPATIQIQNENPATSVIRILGRPLGSTGSYTYIGTAATLKHSDGTDIGGWFNLDASGLSSQNWQLEYLAYDANGGIIDSKVANYQPNTGMLMDPTGISPSVAAYHEAVSLYEPTKTITIYQAANNPAPVQVALMVRPSGSGQAFSLAKQVATNIYPTPYNTQIFNATIDLTGISFPSPVNSGNFDYQLVYKGADGSTVATSSGILSGNFVGQSTYTETSVPVMGPGQAQMTREGSTDYLIVTGLSGSSASVLMHYRPLGSTGAFSSAYLSDGGYGQHGMWVANVTGWGGPYEYWLDPRDSAGNLLGGKSQGTFTVGGQPSTLTQYVDQTPILSLYPPSGQTVTNQRIRYFANGVWSNWIDYGAGGQWNFDASALVGDRYATYNYPIQYETYNNGAIVSQSSFNVTLGFGSQSVSGYSNTRGVPAKVVFNPLQTAGSQVRLYWRDAGSTGAYNVATLANSGGSYAWDVDAAGVRPASGTRNIEYYYDVLDSSGNVLSNLTHDDHVKGTLTISSDGFSNTSTSEIRWVIDTSTASAFMIHRSQTNDAFGDVVSETDGNGNTTTLTYNTEGKLTSKIGPQVNVTSEAGVTTSTNPTEYYYYDASGRQVAQRDANGNLSTQILLAGTGYGGSQAQVTAEYKPGSTTTYGYDVYGDQRKVTDGLGNSTLNFYDADHNLTEVDHAYRATGNSVGTQLKDYYAYDALGRRVRHWTSQFGASVVETTDYDVMSRVVRTVSFAGQVTNYGYAWVAPGQNMPTLGMGNFGGWQKTTANSAGLTEYENDDVFGHVTWRQDFGNHGYLYNYDNAGHLVQQTNDQGQNISYTYYSNGYVASVTDNTLHMKSTFQYDNNGNRTLETYNSTDASPIFYQNAVISYDSLNRMIQFNDAKALITYKYDAAGNIRNVHSIYQDGVSGNQQAQDLWYKYDGQNRFVLSMGALSGSSIVTGTTGIAITYDAAGNRATATYGSDNHTEAYSYTADGYLENVTINGVLASRRTNDALGRVTQYTEYNSDGVTAKFSQGSTYDNDNRLLTQTSDTVSGGTTSRTYQAYDYRAWNSSTSTYSGADQGVVTHIMADQYTVGQNNHIYTQTNYYYSWWDEAKTTSIKINASDPNNPNSGSWAPGLSSMSYDVNGHITQLVDTTAAGGAKTTTYRNDAYGQVMVREVKQNSTLGARQLYYYFNGARIGDVSNDGTAPNQMDYAQQLALRGASTQSGLYRNGKAVSSADFDESYQPINANYPAAAATIYTVRGGDTLSSIAQSVWGDSSLWYLIADANGLSASTTLIAGQRLSIPNKVTNFHKNTGTFKVYDAGEAIGDMQPTLPNEPAPPPAQKHGGCGVLGTILLAVIAVAVAVVTTGAGLALANGASLSSGLATIGIGSGAAISGVTVGGFAAAGAIGGAVGSIVSQGVGVASGIQDQFSWGAVGLGAIAGGVTGGLAGTGAFSGLGKVVGAALRGAVGGAATQGIAIAAGLQSKFDWSDVAASGVGGGIGAWGQSSWGLSGIGAKIVPGVAGGIAASTAESLVDGKDFGDTLIINLPSIAANTIGNLVADQVSGHASNNVVVAENGDGREAFKEYLARQSDIVVNARRKPSVDIQILSRVFGRSNSSIPNKNAAAPSTKLGKPQAFSWNNLNASLATINRELEPTHVVGRVISLMSGESPDSAQTRLLGILGDPIGFIGEVAPAFFGSPIGLLSPVGAAEGAFDQAVIDQILSTPKGLRPDPSSYMSAAQIESQLGQFDAGASRFTLQSNLAKYGPAQADGTTFVMPSSEADQLLASTAGDPRALEQALGLPTGTLNGQQLVRLDVPNPRALNLRIPSGNEAGANPQWIPGGRLPNGNLEAVIDLGHVPASRYNVAPIVAPPMSP